MPRTEMITDDDSHPLDWYPEPVSAAERQAWQAGEPTDSLALIDHARAALAQAETLSDIGAVREIAERARRYASAAKLGREAENHATKLRLDAERRAGELLAEMNLPRGKRPAGIDDMSSSIPAPRLADLGVTPKQSSDWQRMARIPEPVYAAHVEETTRKGKELTTESVVQVARQIEKQRRQAEPKPIIQPETVPARVAVADARSLPLDDDSVHLIVTSPPYALDVAYHEGGDVDAVAWDAFMYLWLREAQRVTAPNGRLALNVPLDTTAGGYRPTYAVAVAAALRAGWTYRSSIVWRDDTITKTTARGSVDSASAPHIIARVEMIALFSKGPWMRHARAASDLHRDEWLSWTDGLWDFPGESSGWEGHPAPFPLRLPHQLVKLLSFPGDVVLDPFCGSGTTLLAAMRLGRQAVGYDRSPAYVESTLRRLVREVADGGRVPTDRGRPDADDEAGVRESLRGPRAEAGEPRGLRPGLHRGAAGAEQQELVSAGRFRRVADSQVAS